MVISNEGTALLEVAFLLFPSTFISIEMLLLFLATYTSRDKELPQIKIKR